MPSGNSVDGPRRPADSPLTPELTNSLLLSDHQQPKEKEKCPRCESRDTKFCYYNNYNTSQPRHFCRSCRRYWTLGGSLRNVPIGGSSRQNTHNTSNKRLRPNPKPNLNPSSTTTVTHHTTGWLEPFRFDLGLGLGIRAGPTQPASIEDMGFALGPTTLVWSSSLLVEGGDVVAGHDCFNAVPAAVSGPGDGSVGPTNGAVH